jgi:hypothetical protein
MSVHFDGGIGRAAWSPEDRCDRSATCALLSEHGGGCDARSEPERFVELYRSLDAKTETKR